MKTGPTNRTPDIAGQPQPVRSTPPQSDMPARARRGRAPVPMAMEGDVTETRADSAHRRDTSRIITAEASATTKMVGIGGTISSPNLVIKPIDVFKRIDQGTLNISIPMRGGRSLGLVSVRDGTHATVQLAIKDGKVDRENTRILFEDANGNPTDLDGPLWWDAESIYIDANGQIRADVPCFPDPNITEQVLGEGVNEVPEDVGEFTRALARGANPEVTLAAATEHRIGGRDGGDPGVRTGPAPRGNATTASGSTQANALDEILDISGIHASFSGTFKPGPISFGRGATIMMAEGAKVDIDGTLGDMHVKVDAPIQGLSMRAGGTRLSTGEGRIGFDVRLRDTDGTDGIDSVRVEVTSLEVDNFKLSTPAEHGRHRIEVGHLSVRSADDRPPLIQSGQGPGGRRRLNVELPRVGLESVSGEFQVTGSDGRPATMELGPTPADTAAAMNVTASISYDSSTRRFAFDSQVTNLSARIRDIALVDTQNFDMTLREATINGSGRFAVVTENGHSTLSMIADKGTEWIIDAQIEDAQIGGDSDSAIVVADIASASSGTLRLSNLELGGETPVFSGSADFEITLDSLHLPIGKNGVELLPGTTGILRIEEMSWRRGDKSPEVRAQLRLTIGADAILEPEEISGLDGARIEVDIETGAAILVLDATLTRDGTLTTDCGIRLYGVGVHTNLTSDGESPLPEVDLPATPLSSVIPAHRMAEVRELVKPPPLPTDTEKIAPPKVEPLRISPSEIFGAIDSTTVTLTVPTDAIPRSRVWSIDEVETRSTVWIDDDVGIRASVHFTREAGPLLLRLDIVDGEVQPGTSRIVLDPPLVVDAWGQYEMRGPLAASASGRGIVRALVIRRDPETGKGMLWPEGELDGWLLDTAELVGLGDTIRGAIGDSLATALLGDARFSLNRDELFATLQGKVPALGEEIVISLDYSENDSVSPPVDGDTTPTPTTPAVPAELQALLGALHFDRARLDVTEARLEPGVISLGEGQSIEFKEGTEVSVTGTTSDFTIEGSAVLGLVELGGDSGTGLRLDGGRAKIRIHVVAGKDGVPPRIEIDVKDLETDSMSASGQSGGLHAVVSEARVRHGDIHIAAGGNEPPTFELDLREVTAKLAATGSATHEDLAGGAQFFIAEVSGSLRIADGKLSGELTSVDLQASGLTFAGPNAGTEAKRLSITGAATLSTDASGVVTLARPTGAAQSLTVSTDITFADGTELVINNGHADKITFALDSQRVELHGLQAELSALVEIGKSDDPARRRILEVRHAEVTGGFSISANGFSTLGEMRVKKFDGSITNIGAIDTKESSLDISQIDLTGSGVISVSPTGDWTIRGNQRRVGDEVHSTLHAWAITRDMRFTTVSPEFNIDLNSGAQLNAEVDEFSFSGSKSGMVMALRHGRLEGTVKTGSVTIGQRDSALESVALGAGTRISASIRSLGIRSGDYAQGGRETNFRLDGTLRLEGTIADGSDGLGPTLEAAGQPFTLEDVGIDGQFRMILSIRYDDGRFAASSHVELDAEINAKGRAELDPRGAMRRALRRAEAERRLPE